MGKLSARVFAYVDLYLLPVAFLISDLLTLAADREKCLKGFNLGKQSARFLYQLVLSIK